MKTGILTPDNDNLPSMLIDFLNYLCSVKGKSLNTVKGYCTDLSMFFKFVKVYKTELITDDISNVIISDINDGFISSIRLSDIYAFINYITIVRKNSAYARARKTASIKSFFKYAVNKSGKLIMNPALELETPKIKKSNPVYLTLDESKKLLNSVDGIYKERDYAIITLFLNCGLRLSELVGINITDIKEDRLTVTGKGNKQRVVYLNKACMNALEQYMKTRPADSAGNKALFLSERKKRISARTVQYIVQKYLKKSNIEGEKYSVHKLRHTAVTLMYKYGKVDIRTLQQILGHESVSTTQIYTHVDDDSLREALNSNPLSNL